MNKKPYVRIQTDKWENEEVDLLKKIYPNMDNEEIAKKLNKTVRSIRSKAQYLSLKKANRYWSRANEKFLLKNWEVLSAIEIGEKLNKTKWAVINKYRELKGLRERKTEVK